MKYSVVIIATMALVVLVAGCTGNNNNVEVVGDNLEVTAHSLDTGSTNSSVNLTVRNKGTSEIPYVPINVIFYDSNGGSNTRDGLVINMKTGEEKNITINSSYPSAKSYKITVGDHTAFVNGEVIANAFEPVVRNYNSSRGPDTSIIPVIGAQINLCNFTQLMDSYHLDSNATIFIELGNGKQYVGKWVYRGTGQVVSGYKLYKDILVIYWPEMRVAGWHRVYGSAPPETATGEYTYITGDDPDIDAWINSLPK